MIMVTQKECQWRCLPRAQNNHFTPRRLADVLYTPRPVMMDHNTPACQEESS